MIAGLRRRWTGASKPWSEATYCALDVETSGLDGRRDEIVAIGCVPVRGGTIRYGERFETLVRPGGNGSGEGIRAHHILPGELDGAPALGTVAPEIELRLQDAVLLLHFAPIDLTFLRSGWHAAGRCFPKTPVVDTAQLLARLDRRRLHLEAHPEPLPTRLAEARSALGLPPHANHHALADALATAELFLVLRARLDARTLGELL